MSSDRFDRTDDMSHERQPDDDVECDCLECGHDNSDECEDDECRCCSLDCRGVSVT